MDIDWNTWEPKEHATLCLICRGDEVLLIRKKRGLGAGKINAPGGRLDPGETPLQAAIRETQEEVGLTPLNLELRAVLRFQFTNGYGVHCSVFYAPDCEGEMVETDEAVPIWTALDAIPYEEMWADDALWIPHFLAGRRVEGWFLFDEDVMLTQRLEMVQVGAENEDWGA